MENPQEYQNEQQDNRDPEDIIRKASWIRNGLKIAGVIVSIAIVIAKGGKFTDLISSIKKMQFKQ